MKPETLEKSPDLVLVAKRAVIALGSSIVELSEGQIVAAGSPSHAAAVGAKVEFRGPRDAAEQRRVEEFRRRQAAQRADDRAAIAAQPVTPVLAPIVVPCLSDAARIVDEDSTAVHIALATLNAEKARCKETIPYQAYYPVFLGGRAAASRAPAEALVGLLVAAATLREIWQRGPLAASRSIENARQSLMAPPPASFDAHRLINSLPQGCLQLIDGKLGVRGELHAQTLDVIRARRDEIVKALKDVRII